MAHGGAGRSRFDCAAKLSTSTAINEASAADAAEPDAEWIHLLHQRGLLALTVPRQWGGQGADLTRAREVIAAVARGNPSTALVLTMHVVQTRLLSDPACRWPRETRARLLHDVVRRGVLLIALRAEPAPIPGGLPVTLARRSAAGWRLSGHKLCGAGIDHARWCIVWARTDEPTPRVGAFLVARESPGVNPVRGLCAGASQEVAFDDVALPLEHAVDLRFAPQWPSAPDGLQHLWTRVLLATLRDAIGWGTPLNPS